MKPISYVHKSTWLSDLSPYIYGTTRLGDEHIPFADRVSIARAAMDAGVWFHTSHTYGDALNVLRAAFDQDHARTPKLIVKIGWSTIEELRDMIHQNLDPLGLDSLDLGQLCLGGQLADEFFGRVDFRHLGVKVFRLAGPEFNHGIDAGGFEQFAVFTPNALDPHQIRVIHEAEDPFVVDAAFCDDLLATGRRAAFFE